MRPGFVALTAIAIAGCGSKPSRQAGADAAAGAVLVTETPAPETPPEVPPGTRSLRLLRTVAVRLGPDEKSKRIGTIAGETRVTWKSTAAGSGCKKPWFALDGVGWICGDYLEPSTKSPGGGEIPRLERGEIVPGTYGKVSEAGTNVYVLPAPPPKKPKGNGKGKEPPPAPETTPKPTGLIKGRPLLGSVNVRQFGELVHNGRPFWKITNRGEAEYLPASAIREHKPSMYRGVRLGDDTGMTLPIAFVWPRGGGQKAWTRGAGKGGGNVRQASQREAVPVLEEYLEDDRVVAYRIGEREWIDAKQVRLVKPAVPPAGVGPKDRWMDLDLDLQVLVAYEGSTPVFATMVSTGTKETPTETGIYRIWKKASEADMKGLTGEDPYSVATVPWTQWFSPERGLALHTAYWHDRFGVPRSHGCVNLSPIDARWLYFFSDPQTPPGWSMSAGVVEAPGSVLRVRSKDDPAPPMRGYAQKVGATGDDASPL